MKEKLPNSTVSLILGILSIPTCCLPYGIVSIALGVTGFILGNKAIKLHNEDPDLYDGVGNAKAGKITSIIGIVIGIAVLILAIYFANNPELLEEWKQWAEEQQARNQ